MKAKHFGQTTVAPPMCSAMRPRIEMQNATTTQTTKILKSADETRMLGETLAQELKPGDLVTLSGPLGAGKTTLAQGLARGLGVQNVTSPTFVLLLEHEAQREGQTFTLAHLDAYRLENQSAEDLSEAGILDFLDRMDAIKLVEWPERIAAYLPTPRLQIVLKPGDSDDERIITIHQTEPMC